MVRARDAVRAWCARHIRAVLPVGGQVLIGQVVAGQTLVSHDTGAFENCQGETWESAYVDLIGRQTRRRANRSVVSEFDARKMHISIVLSFVDDQSQHLGHNVVHPINASVTDGVVGACSKLVHAQQLIYGL